MDVDASDEPVDRWDFETGARIHESITQRGRRVEIPGMDLGAVRLELHR